MKLGIIGAMDVEVATLKAKMENVNTRQIAGSAYFEGTLEGAPAAGNKVLFSISDGAGHFKQAQTSAVGRMIKQKRHFAYFTILRTIQLDRSSEGVGVRHNERAEFAVNLNTRQSSLFNVEGSDDSSNRAAFKAHAAGQMRSDVDLPLLAEMLLTGKQTLLKGF